MANVCLILPAYNEADVIADVVIDLRHAMLDTDHTFEIVVVNDGSTDATGRKAAAAGARVVSHILNAGSGGATATGLSYAFQHGFDLAATLDADGQHKPEDVIKGIGLMESGLAELIIGSRLIDRNGMSNVKVLGNFGLSIITRVLFGILVTDSQSGLRIFSRNTMKTLKWKSSGYEFCSEMLWRAKQKGLSIKEYPIQAIYTEYSRSKGQNNWNGFNIVKSLLQRRIMELFGE